MNPIPKISLEQWVVFRTVVEEGTYAKAAEQLNRSQSSVSYALARMEEQLPSPELTLVGRKAQLTELGNVLYQQSGYLLEQALSLQTLAEYAAQGWEPEVIIAIDALQPITQLFSALQHFSEKHRGARVRVLETTLSATDEAILERQAALAITPNVPTGFVSTPLWAVRLVTVVAGSHPLASQKDEITETDCLLGSTKRWMSSGFHRRA